MERRRVTDKTSEALLDILVHETARRIKADIEYQMEVLRRYGYRGDLYADLFIMHEKANEIINTTGSNPAITDEALEKLKPTSRG